MAWRRLGDKLLSETMIVRLPTHICFCRPQLATSQRAENCVISENETECLVNISSLLILQSLCVHSWPSMASNWNIRKPDNNHIKMFMYGTGLETANIIRHEAFIAADKPCQSPTCLSRRGTKHRVYYTRWKGYYQNTRYTDQRSLLLHDKHDTMHTEKLNGIYVHDK